jgi:hypothetical protein
MTPVFNLDPVRRSAGAVWPVLMFRYQPLQAELAGLPEQVRADLALLILADENAVRPPRQQACKVVLAKVQGQLPQILAAKRQDIEGVELRLTAT